MSFETLKATINSNIVSGLPDGIRADYENNPTLQDIVSAFGQDHIYMGSATVGTSPMTDDNARMYISSGSGEFTAFRDSGNNAINISEGEIAILKGISGVYEKDVFFSGDTIDDAGSVRINDTGSLIQLQAKYNGSWVTASEFGYIGGDITLQDVVSSSVNANSVVVNGSVESTSNTDVKDYLCIDGEVLVSQNEYLYADEFIEDRLESTTGEYIPNTASNSLAEIGMDTINDKCVLYNEAVTSEVGVIESIVPDSTDGNFDVTRSSITNRVNRDGFIEEVPANTASYNYTSGDTRPYLLTEAASTNLITYPKSFGNSYWTKSGATIEGDASSAGSELHTSANAASDPNGNEANATTGWVVVNGMALTSDASAPQTGGYALKGVSIGIAFGRMTYSFSGFTIGSMYKVSIWAKRGIQGTDQKIAAWAGFSSIPITSISSTSWQEYVFYVVAISTTPEIRIYSNYTTTVSGDEVYADNISIKEVQPFEAPKEIPSTNGVELVTNGDFSSSTGWSLRNNWTVSGGTLNTVSESDYSAYTIGDMSNKIVKVTYDITSHTTGGVSVRFFGSESQIGIYRGAVGTYTEYIQVQSSHNGDFGFQALSSFTGSVDNVSVKEVTSYSGGGFERDAYKLVEDTNNSAHYINNATSSVTSGATVTHSTFVKAAERSWIALYESYSIGSGYYFDLTNGVLGATIGITPDSYSIREIANGWYRISITTTVPSTSARIRIALADSDGGTTYTGDGTSGLYIAYAQLEESGYASSLMLPTTEGSITSRVADAVTNAGNQSLFSSVNSSGVLFAEIGAHSDDGTNRWISISKDANNYVGLVYTAATNQVALFINVASSLVIKTYTLTDETNFSKIAIRWATNDYSLWVDGVEEATDATQGAFSTNDLTTLNFGDSGGGSNFYAKTKAIAVFEYLSDYEMIRLTK